MKTLASLAFAATLFAATTAGAEDAARPLALGEAAPMRDVKMENVDGRTLSIADVAGTKGTLVVFTCNHCPWAKMWEGRVAAIGNAAIKRGVGVIAINSNDPAMNAGDGIEGMKARAKQLGLKFPYVVDATSDVARAFGATRTPEVFLFDARGALVYHGTVDDNAKEPKSVKEHWMRSAVEAVAAGKPVAVAETKALGCTIKFRDKKSS
jgi:peroxiredoxin